MLNSIESVSRESKSIKKEIWYNIKTEKLILVSFFLISAILDLIAGSKSDKELEEINTDRYLIESLYECFILFLVILK